MLNWIIILKKGPDTFYRKQVYVMGFEKKMYPAPFLAPFLFFTVGRAVGLLTTLAQSMHQIYHQMMSINVPSGDGSCS